ncbi:MAG: transporter [Bacteroidetes bacterium]|jgi:uncharacterized membrane protein YedE/YeeE|nr:transporter [Bacteroidota bacterium]MDF2453504.1 transporter [Bacteroidota bacterium]
MKKNIKFILLGILFGIILIKAEVTSWFRIQEMFRFQSFHMYGIICTAIVVGIISVWLIKKYRIKSVAGEEINIAPKIFHKGNIFGAIIFGLGWAMTGACPGPMYALIGSGYGVFIVILLSAVFGTYIYGLLKDKLSH